MVYIFRLPWWQKHIRPKLTYIYDINGIKLFGYGSSRVYLTENPKIFFLSKDVTYQLEKIKGFYEVLNWISDDRMQMLYDSVYYDSEYFRQKAEKYSKETGGRGYFIYLEWCGNGMEQCSYRIVYDEEDEKIKYSHEEPYEEWYDDKGKIEGELTPQEFNLLMQIYFGVYDDNKLRDRLERKKKRGEYDGIKEYLDVDKIYRIFSAKEEQISEEDKKLLEEYLKLQLMRKPIEGAFPELSIKKIYDVNWSEEEQRRVVETINRELGKKLMILNE